MHRVDVHVLHCHEPKEWLDLCIGSLAQEPVNVFLCPGIPGQVGLSRARAFENGTAEYVSFVDGDDAVMEGAFKASIELLDKRPDIVSTYTDVTVIGWHSQPIGSIIKGPWEPWRQLHMLSELHHLHVMRRSAVMQCLEVLSEWVSLEEWVLMAELCRFGVHHHISERRYLFRQHGSYTRAGAMITPKLRRIGIKKYTELLMDMHRRGVKQHETTAYSAGDYDRERIEKNAYSPGGEVGREENRKGLRVQKAEGIAQSVMSAKNGPL